MPDSTIQAPLIGSTGKYKVDVVGESFYRKNFVTLCGEKTITGVKVKVIAQLTLEDHNPYDKRAVSVWIQGLQVGHLSRDCARALRRRVRYGSLSEHETFDCAALICGGWDRGDGDVGEFGVRLDLNLSDE